MAFAFALTSLFAVAACSATPPDRISVRAISSDSQEAVPCAIFVDGERQNDASGAPLATPVSIDVVFRADPSGVHKSNGIKLSVYPLLSENGKLRLPVEGTNDPPPLYRFDRHAERVVRSSDARTQLFILLPNGDGRWYELPSKGATINAGN